MMGAREIAAILEAARANFSVEAGAEITLEANPATINRLKMAELRRLGVNRLSLGVQSFDDGELSFLGRAHNAEEALQAAEDAAAEFPNYNLDFIYGLPGQTLRAWKKALTHPVLRAAPHLSLYQLSVERKTALWREGAREAGEAAALFMWRECGRTARRYEVSNYARTGFESVHNLGYWRGRDYIGIGAGAAGRVSDGGRFYETANPRTFAKWAAQEEPRPVPLPRIGRAREMVLSGLRMAKGIDLKEFEKRSGIAFSSVAKACPDVIIDGGRAQARKLEILDAILREIL